MKKSVKRDVDHTMPLLASVIPAMGASSKIPALWTMTWMGPFRGAVFIVCSVVSRSVRSQQIDSAEAPVSTSCRVTSSDIVLMSVSMNNDVKAH